MEKIPYLKVLGEGLSMIPGNAGSKYCGALIPDAVSMESLERRLVLRAADDAVNVLLALTTQDSCRNWSPHTKDD
jgi:hypothetical protein